MTTQIPGNENNPAAVVPVLRFRQALEKVRAEAAQLTPSELSSINLEIPSAIITVRGCVPELQALRPRIVTELPAVDLVQFDNVETYALALTQAHSQFLSASQPPVPIAELTEKLKLARELFLSDVSALARRQLLDGTRLDELKGATGPKNIATDVLMLAAMLRDNWDAIVGKTGVKLSELDEVEQMADSPTNALGIKEQGPSRSSAVSDQRQRVHTVSQGLQSGASHRDLPSVGRRRRRYHRAVSLRRSPRKAEQRRQHQGRRPCDSWHRARARQ